MRLYNVVVVRETGEPFVFGPYPDVVGQLAAARGLARMQPGSFIYSLVWPPGDNPVLALHDPRDVDRPPEASDGR